MVAESRQHQPVDSVVGTDVKNTGAEPQGEQFIPLPVPASHYTHMMPGYLPPIHPGHIHPGHAVHHHHHHHHHQHHHLYPHYVSPYYHDAMSSAASSSRPPIPSPRSAFSSSKAMSSSSDAASSEGMANSLFQLCRSCGDTHLTMHCPLRHLHWMEASARDSITKDEEAGQTYYYGRYLEGLAGKTVAGFNSNRVVFDEKVMEYADRADGSCEVGGVRLSKGSRAREHEGLHSTAYERERMSRQLPEAEPQPVVADVSRTDMTNTGGSNTLCGVVSMQEEVQKELIQRFTDCTDSAEKELLRNTLLSMRATWEHMAESRQLPEAEPQPVDADVSRTDVTNTGGSNTLREVVSMQEAVQKELIQRFTDCTDSAEKELLRNTLHSIRATWEHMAESRQHPEAEQPVDADVSRTDVTNTGGSNTLREVVDMQEEVQKELIQRFTDCTDSAEKELLRNTLLSMRATWEHMAESRQHPGDRTRRNAPKPPALPQMPTLDTTAWSSGCVHVTPEQIEVRDQENGTFVITEEGMTTVQPNTTKRTKEAVHRENCTERGCSQCLFNAMDKARDREDCIGRGTQGVVYKFQGPSHFQTLPTVPVFFVRKEVNLDRCEKTCAPVSVRLPSEEKTQLIASAIQGEFHRQLYQNSIHHIVKLYCARLNPARTGRSGVFASPPGTFSADSGAPGSPSAPSSPAKRSAGSVDFVMEHMDFNLDQLRRLASLIDQRVLNKIVAKFPTRDAFLGRSSDSMAASTAEEGMKNDRCSALYVAALAITAVATSLSPGYVQQSKGARYVHTHPPNMRRQCGCSPKESPITYVVLIFVNFSKK